MILPFGMKLKIFLKILILTLKFYCNNNRFKHNAVKIKIKP